MSSTLFGDSPQSASKCFSESWRDILRLGPRTPLLDRHKFTNAYRASDRVSQYLIRFVIYQGDQTPEEIFFRTILFKLFNKIETWELLILPIGVPYFQGLFFCSLRRDLR